MLFAVISNTSSIGQDNIEFQMFLMNCPYPVYNALPMLDVDPIDGFTVIYTMNYSIAHVNKVSVFECFDSNAGLPLPRAPTVNLIVYEPTESFFTAFDNAFAWIGYIYNLFTALFQKATALLTLVGYIVTPINFNILGYGISDISGTGLLFIIFLYAFCYISIGVWLYKVIMPFGGSS